MLVLEVQEEVEEVFAQPYVEQLLMVLRGVLVETGKMEELPEPQGMRGLDHPHEGHHAPCSIQLLLSQKKSDGTGSSSAFKFGRLRS